MGILPRLRSKPALSTALGVSFAIIAGLMLLGLVSRAFRSDPGGAMVSVQVARRDIPLGATLTARDLATRRIPSGYLVPGTIRLRSGVTGAQAVRFIGRGEPVTASSIAGGRGTGNMAAEIPADMRAYSIQLARTPAGTTGLRPGDKVDVLATSGEPPRTTTLLGARLVLSVGSGSSRDNAGDQSDGGAPCVTLLVSPPEAELLAQATCTGEISVSLCPNGPAARAR